jgi:DNA invertase Pin-like site-specific DNA recombinase
MSAYAYLRKSVVHNAAREVSPAMQEDLVRALATRNGDTALTVLSDMDKSGRLGRDKRPGYDALLTAIEDGTCTALYSYSLSRLGRSLPELARLVKDCVDRGIPVRLHADAVDTSTASGMLQFHMLAAMAQFESDIASERQHDSNNRKRAEGRPVGTSKFYGQAPREDPAAVLQAFHDAGSYSGAARLLNERGIVARNGKAWWTSSVHVVVRRLDTSLAVRKGRGVAAAGGPYRFSRLLTCPTCGTLLTGYQTNTGRGGVRYVCRRSPALAHVRGSISEAKLTPSICAEAERLAPAGSLSRTSKGARGGDYDALVAKRSLILDAFFEKVIDKEQRDLRLAKVDAALAKVEDRRVLSIRPRLGFAWGSPDEDVREVNRTLRDLWVDVALDETTFMPVAFSWRVPEWRSAVIVPEPFDPADAGLATGRSWDSTQDRERSMVRGRSGLDAGSGEEHGRTHG